MNFHGKGAFVYSVHWAGIVFSLQYSWQNIMLHFIRNLSLDVVPLDSAPVSMGSADNGVGALYVIMDLLK